MKRIISICLCVILVLSMVPSVYFASNAVTTPVHLDFSGYNESSKTYETYCFLGQLYSGETDSSGNKYIRVYHKDYLPDNNKTDNPYINFNSRLTSDAVFGFSYNTADSLSAFRLQSKADDSAESINPLLTVKGNKIYVKGDSTNPIFTSVLGEWVDVALGMDYGSDGNARVYVYINSELKTIYSPGSAVTHTNNFNITLTSGIYTDAQNAQANDDYASVCFDDFFVYYPPSDISCGIGTTGVNPDISGLTVRFNQKVIYDKNNFKALINGSEVSAELVYEYGYVTALRLTGLELEPDTDYTVSFSGIKNLLNSNIGHTFNYSTAAYDIIGNKAFLDFSDGTSLALHSQNPYGGTIDVRHSDSDHGDSLYFEFDGSSTTDIPVARVAGSNEKGIYVYEADYCFSSVSADVFNFFKCTVTKTDGSTGYNSIYEFENGVVSAHDKAIYSGVEASSKDNLKWYNFKATYDMETGKSCFYVDGFPVAENIALNTPDFASVKYINCHVPVISGKETWMYVDNISSYVIAPRANVSVSIKDSSLLNAPYENCEITLAFDRKMDSAALSHAALKADDGTEISLGFSSEDGKVFVATAAVLKANMTYNVQLAGVKTAYGAGINEAELKIKTKKLPFCIDNVTKTTIGDNVRLVVDIKNDNLENRTFVLMAGLCDGIMMLESDVKFIETSAGGSYEFVFTKPDADYSAEVYLFDTILNLNITDKFMLD